MTGGGDDAATPFQETYAWTASTSASGEQTAAAYNGAGLSTGSAFTVTPDTTPPSGQSIALSGGPFYTALSVALTLDDGSDGGAGVDPASGIVERDSAPLSGGTCGSFSDSWTQVTLTGGADTTVLSGHCYRYRYSVSDFVGNASEPSSA